MKIPRPLAAARLVLLLPLFLFLGACGSIHRPFSPTPELIGTWQNRHNSLWTLRSDGTFEMRHGGYLNVTGTYSIGSWPNRDKLTLEYTGGTIPRDGHEPALYRIKGEKKAVRFILLHDVCALRIADLSGKWKKKSP